MSIVIQTYRAARALAALEEAAPELKTRSYRGTNGSGVKSEYLNAVGIPTPKGCQWTPSSFVQFQKSVDRLKQEERQFLDDAVFAVKLRERRQP